jgi:heme exporter protein B
MWRDAWLVAAKDLRVEARAKVALRQILPFALTVLVLFAFALDPSRLPALAAGLMWVAVLLCAVLAVQRSFAMESSGSTLDGLRLFGLDPAGVFLGKAAALAVQLLLLEALLAGGVVVLYGASLHGGLVLAGAGLAATAGLACAGCVYGALAGGGRLADTLLPVLFLPVVSPVLLGATKAWEAALAGTPGQGEPWLRLLAVFAVVYAALGALAFGPVLEEA